MSIDIDRFGFDITDDQREVRAMMLRFAEDRLAPGAAEHRIQPVSGQFHQTRRICPK